LINGSKGQMGQTLLTCAARLPHLQVVAGIDVGDDLAAAAHHCDAIIDFSFHSVTPRVARLCAERKIAFVVGTTGHTDAEKSILREAAQVVPVVWTSNFSTGVNALFWLTRKAVEILGPSFDIEVIEMHHRLKKDAPSGTAAALLEILAAARRLALPEALRHGRQGITGQRTSGEIGVHSLRGGDVVGDHTVVFAANGERVELTHKAGSRETFALGALRAAQWLVGKAPGIYDMEHVLGLK
jgi:4-hydroxy-tetrahydrodipicolinate reductase